MIERKKVRIRPLRSLIYLLWMAVTALLFFLFRSYFLGILFLFFLSLPPVSFGAALFLIRHLEPALGTDGMRTTEGEDFELIAELRNSLWYGALSCDLSMDVQNKFYPEENPEHTLLSMPVRGTGLPRREKRKTRLLLPLQAREIGRYEFIIHSLEIQDWLGLLKITCSAFARAELMVLPKSRGSAGVETETFSAGMTEAEESNRRGNDFAEVSDIREYVPGDRIRDIHWKLSARQEVLMVKERTQMSGSELVVLFSLSDDREQTGQILRYGYGLLTELIRGHFDIKLLFFDSTHFFFEEFTCGTTEELALAFYQLFGMSYRLRLAPGQGYDGILYNLYPFLSSYVKIGETGEGIGWEMVEHG